MARKSKPWFWEARGIWCVKINGHRHNLGEVKKDAFDAFYQLMAASGKAPTTGKASKHKSVVVLIDEFLDWCQKNKPKSFEWYCQFLLPFCKTVPDLRIDELKPHHLEDFIDKPTWGPSGRRAAITAIKRPFNWALKRGEIGINPLRSVEKPNEQIREMVIPLSMHKQILKFVGKPFAELLELAWETGARPFELYLLETRHLELKSSRAVFPREESKGKKRQRVIYFSKKALAIVKRNMQAKGPVLRNADGKAWTAYSINCAFLRLQTAMGRQAAVKPEKISDEQVQAKMTKIRESRERKGKVPLSESALRWQARKSVTDAAIRKHALKLCLYAYRHSFGHRKLTEGTDSLVVATLMGHKDTVMLAKVYGHLMQNQGFLLAQLNQ